MVYEIVNLTDHTVDIGGVSWPPSGRSPRLQFQPSKEVKVPVITPEDEVRWVSMTTNRRVIGCSPSLPPEKNGVLLVVPRVVAEHFPDRRDLIVPDRLVRNSRGMVVGCSAFGAPNGFPAGAMAGPFFSEFRMMCLLPEKFYDTDPVFAEMCAHGEDPYSPGEVTVYYNGEADVASAVATCAGVSFQVDVAVGDSGLPLVTLRFVEVGADWSGAEEADERLKRVFSTSHAMWLLDKIPGALLDLAGALDV